MFGKRRDSMETETQGVDEVFLGHGDVEIECLPVV